MGLPPPASRPPGREPKNETLESASDTPAPTGDPDAPASRPFTRTSSAWSPRAQDFGPPRGQKDPDEEDPRHNTRIKQSRRRSILFLFLFGAIAFISGYWTAYESAFIPGIFWASELGIPAVLAILLTGMARILRHGIHDVELAQATAALPGAARWALLSFWLLFTFTTVFQLAIGVALAILAFQLYATRDRLRRAGYTGFGPGLRLMLIPLGAYAGWLLIVYFQFTVTGPIPLFDLLSMIATFLFAFAMLKETIHRAEATKDLQPQSAIKRAAPAARGATAKHLLGAILVGYIFFRFFVSAHIPYGPIVEWFIVSMAALFFAIIAAARIGTVPTRRSLPPPYVRTHRQRVWSLPDRHLSEVERHLAAYIHENKGRDWLRAHYQALLESSDVPAEQRARSLQELERRRSHEDERRQTILRLSTLLERSTNPTDPANPTDTVKTNPPVPHHPETTPH